MRLNLNQYGFLKQNKLKSPNHPKAAYFTTLPPRTPNLAARLRVPRRKLEYVFAFHNVGDLNHIRGGRGKYIFYSPDDYEVVEKRQIWHGKSDEFPKE